MKTLINTCLLLGFTALLSACYTPSSHVRNLRLGMSYDEVQEAMNKKPFSVRAAKVYEGEEWSDIWEYRPDIFSLAAITEKYDRMYLVYFENGRVVQWGEPGDFVYDTTLTASDRMPIIEYKSQKSE